MIETILTVMALGFSAIVINAVIMVALFKWWSK